LFAYYIGFYPRTITDNCRVPPKLRAMCWRMKPLPVWSVPLCVVLTLVSWCTWWGGEGLWVGVSCKCVCMCGVCDGESQ